LKEQELKIMKGLESDVVIGDIWKIEIYERSVGIEND
jgi:hypothetical protein